MISRRLFCSLLTAAGVLAPAPRDSVSGSSPRLSFRATASRKRA